MAAGSTAGETAADEQQRGTRRGGRALRRAVIPTAVVAGAAALGTTLWPALASDGSPDLPEVTAEELLTRIAESETEQFYGTVSVNADFGLPDLGGVLDRVLDGVADQIGGPAGAVADLVSGEATLRVAVDGPERQRLAVAQGEDEFAVIHNGDELWAYDSASETVYQAQVPEGVREGQRGSGPEDWLGGFTPREAAQQALEEAGRYADVSVDGSARVAGRDAYQLVVEPTSEAAERTGVSSVRISVDAQTGVPLAVTADGPEGRVLDVAFSQLTYQQPPGGQFEFTPPEGADVVEINPQTPLPDLLPEILPGLLPDA